MIYVITHKDFNDSILDAHYRILHVGSSKCSKTYLRDDVDKNISNKNSNYCELTGLYWIWQNGRESDNDIIGLVHYRRYFTTTISEWKYTYFNIMPSMLEYKVIEKALEKYDLILPSPRKIFRTIRQYYNDIHIAEDMDITRRVLAAIYPEYLVDFDNVMNMHEYYYGNMIVCKTWILKDYAEWLFNILFEVEQKIDINKYKDNYQKRVFGFLSERLLQVWVLHSGLKVKEFPAYNTEARRMTIFATYKKRFQNLIKRFH